MNVSALVDTLPSKQLEACHILRPIGYYFIFLWIFGTVLNGSILFILIRNKQLRQSSTNIFIGGLLLADFIGAYFEIPLPAFSLIYCRWTFTYAGCVFEAIISYFAGCSNMYMLCLISIDKYSVISASFSSTMIIIRRTYTAIGCAYILALFWAIMPLFGWSVYDYEGIGVSCSIKWGDKSYNVISYNMTILIFVYLVPVMIILIANIKIYLLVRDRWRSVASNLNKSHVRRQYLIERRVIHTIIFIIGGFFIAWTPYAILVFTRVVIDEHYFSPITNTIPALFAKTSLIWNPLIYAVRNGNFRKYISFFTDRRRPKRTKTSDEIHFSIYPYSMVRLPLPPRPNSREL